MSQWPPATVTPPTTSSWRILPSCHGRARPAAWYGSGKRCRSRMSSRWNSRPSASRIPMSSQEESPLLVGGQVAERERQNPRRSQQRDLSLRCGEEAVSASGTEGSWDPLRPLQPSRRLWGPDASERGEGGERSSMWMQTPPPRYLIPPAGNCELQPTKRVRSRPSWASVRPPAQRAPLPYPFAHIGFTGEVNPRDVAFLLSWGISRNALRQAFAFALNELATLYRNHTPLTLRVVPHFSACHLPRLAFVYHWSLPPPTPPFAGSHKSFPLFLSLAKLCHRLSGGHCQQTTTTYPVLMDVWPGTLGKFAGAEVLTWDNFPTWPLSPWPRERRLWVLTYGAPERCVTLYLNSDVQPTDMHVRLRALFVQALRLVGHQPQLSHFDMWVRLRIAHL